jgi:hypothetical protein
VSNFNNSRDDDHDDDGDDNDDPIENKARRVRRFKNKNRDKGHKVLRGERMINRPRRKINVADFDEWEDEWEDY